MTNDDKHICTKDNPWNDSIKGGAIHPDAKELYQSEGGPGGDIVEYKCPNCGLVFEQELPQ